ncbi:hypothetical protein LX32DRAFT_691285 [Colletotrichum zoysiae]|uniref:C2H2-type domain-containing protein n=1 Tax=Colletotrichum zoysiae TaxID=1216348 RepID=A0AAD9HPF8_9PEZI|nr:hypothetical protein LX32DRAFT_691285 [Colletotrichum zoysiae]
MSPQDMRLLRELAGRYGSGSVESTLRNLGGNNIHTALRPPPPQHHNSHHHHHQQQHGGNPERDSTLSTSTCGSNHSAPSLTSSSPWSNNSDASLCGSDAGSFYGGRQQHHRQEQQQSQDAWHGGDDNDMPFLLSPSVTPSLSSAEWQDRHINEHLSTPSREKTAAATAAVRSPRRSKPIECPLCAVYDVRVGFGRRSDFKKHLQNFHNTDCAWVCPERGCRMVLDFEKAFVTHYKIDHGDVHPPPGRVRVELCTQVVFACGFLGCKEVVEASDDGGAAAAADMYFDHLAGHFGSCSAGAGASAPPAEWAYHHQVQNLLRQRALKDEWKHTLWDKTARKQLRWQPRSSGDLRKLLECRHLADVPRVLHAAWTLGQSSFSSPEHPPPAAFPGAAARPLRNGCPLSITGHNELHHRGSFGQRRPLFHTTLATVSRPPPRSAPDEPDSRAYPHPGTPLVLPEHDAWSTDVVLGPREDDAFEDPVICAGAGANAAAVVGSLDPVSPWTEVQTLGGLAPAPPRRLRRGVAATADDREAFGAFFQTSSSSSKRPGSWAQRLKRLSRSSPAVEDKARAHPDWI